MFNQNFYRLCYIKGRVSLRPLFSPRCDWTHLWYIWCIPPTLLINGVWIHSKHPHTLPDSVKNDAYGSVTHFINRIQCKFHINNEVGNPPPAYANAILCHNTIIKWHFMSRLPLTLNMTFDMLMTFNIDIDCVQYEFKCCHTNWPIS